MSNAAFGCIGTASQAPGGGISEEQLWRMVRGAYPYRHLSRAEYEQVLHMLSEGVETRRSRRGAYIHRDRIHGMLRARRGAHVVIVDQQADQLIIVRIAQREPVGTRVDDSWAIEIAVT